jgi:hypothetical protein
MLTLLAPVYNKVGFTAKPTDEHLDILLRNRVVSTLGTQKKRAVIEGFSVL